MPGRNVRGLLVSVPKPHDGGLDPIRDINTAVHTFAEKLVERFSQPALTVLTDGAATYAAVTAELARSWKDVDLAILLFAGHGATRTGPRGKYQSWLLHDGELRDDELAETIASISTTTEILLVSDCCFGGGIRMAGPFKTGKRGVLDTLRDYFDRSLQHVLPVPDLLALSRGLHPVALLDKVSPLKRTEATKPIVCIAAAAWNYQVAYTAQSLLIDQIRDAMLANATHGDLADDFDEQISSGFYFQLYPRPNNYMCAPLLRAEPTALQKGTAMTSYVVLVNYHDATQTVAFKLNQNIRVTEMFPPGVTTSAYQAQGTAARPTALSLEPGAIVGFVVDSDVDIRLPTTGVCILSRGKNPPMPPPPKPQRFDRLTDEKFAEEFAGTFGLGGVEDEDGDEGGDTAASGVNDGESVRALNAR